MIGLGTIINIACIVLGGILGALLGKFLTEKIQDAMVKSCGVSVIFIGLSGTLAKMLVVTEKGIQTYGAMLIVVSLALGAFIGEIIDLDTYTEKFGEWLKRKSGNSNDAKFVDGFVSASVIVCIGAMSVVGPIQDALEHNYTILTLKGILDGIIVMAMTTSLGKGCTFSAIPVGIIQGTFTILARLIQPILTDLALTNLSLVGHVLIFCIGLNLVFGKTIKVANLLPALVFAVIWAFLPF